MAQLHVEHVRGLLDRVRDGYSADGDPESIFLGGEEGDFFHELVGFRLQGVRTPVLAALRFQRYCIPGIPFARESLAAYLGRPPHSHGYGRSAAAGRIVALMPSARERIPAFLASLRAGRETNSIMLDPRRIRLAFDFRAYNPSLLELDKLRAGPLRTFAMRTVDGHVLTGRSHDIGGAKEHAFVALTEVAQIMPQSRLRLPNVMLSTSWLATWTDTTEEAARLAAENWVPFQAAGANPNTVLGLLPTPRPGAPPTPASPPAGRFPGAIAPS